MTITVSANNGQAPASALSAMPGRNGDGSSQTSPHAVANSYARIRAGMQSASLGDLLPSDGWSCYRDRAAQQHMRDLGLTTIPVGQSIHGEWSVGGAVDFANLGGFGAPRHNWLRDNGGQHGWYQPGWAQAGGSLPEPWHWEYDSRLDTEGEDDFMSYLSYEEQRRLLMAADQTLQWGPKQKEDTDRLPHIHAQVDNTLAMSTNNNNGIWQILDTLGSIGTPSGRSVAIVFLVVIIAAVMGVLVALYVAAAAGGVAGVGVLVGGLLGWLGGAGRRERAAPPTV